MSQRDIIGLILSYAYAFGLLLAGETIRKWRNWPQDFTRKVVHIGAGLWVWGLLALFDHWTVGIIPFATFILLNYLFYRRQTFRSVDAADSSPGTVYFVLSNTILLILFWRTGGAPGSDRAPIAVAAIMAMTLGDAFAAIIGKNWGRSPYHIIPGTSRTVLGSAAMAVFSFLGIALALILLPGSALSPNSVPLGLGAALWRALAATLVATVAEAASPAGTDNLSVPLLTGLVIYVLSR